MAAEAVEKVIESETEEPEPFGPPIIEGDTKPVRLRPAEEEVAFAEAVEVTADETAPVVEEIAFEEIPAEMAVEGTPELEEGVAGDLAKLAAASALIDESSPTGFESEDEAMAWLEGLAARQGAVEEELLTKPEERPVETPDWIQQYAGEAAEEAAIPEEEVPSEGSHVLTDISKVVAAGLVGKEILDREEVAEEPQAAVPEPAEWLPEAALPEAVLPQAALVEAALVEETVEPIETEAEAPTEAEMEAQAQPAPEEVELPDWLRGLEAEAAEPTPEIVAGEWTPPEEFAAIGTVAALAEESPRLDINTASLAQLERIPGIGFITAQSIVAYREVNGPFTSLDQLQEIPGIPPETYDDINRQLYVEAVAVAAPSPSRVPELAQAWQNVVNGNTPAAVEQYTHFIREKQELDEIIAEINEALQLYPLDPLLYQTLGDAYLRADRLPEAMDAYNHAEDLIK
jgi:competence protein ComEA